MNERLLLIEIVTVFLLLLVVKKFFGKNGVLAWIPLVTVIANILTAKNATIFGMNTALGSVLFASTFLAMDILTECYGVRDAKRGVLLGLFGVIVFMICSQIALYYQPSPIDYASTAMSDLFTLNFRVNLASVIMYLIANMGDVFLYEKLRQKTQGKKMWLRNNVSTIFCNCVENFMFVLFGFYGLYDFSQCMSIACSISLVEALVGICDTPFLYLAVKMNEN